MSLTIGIPKEIKTLEKRVGMTPTGVSELCRSGIPVWVESGAGLASGFSDEEYLRAGAKLAESAKSLYGQVQIIQKVKEPLPAEFEYLRPDLILFSFLHLAAPSACDLVRALCEKKVTELAFETLEIEGRRPLLSPMSEIAGALAALYAAYFYKRLKFGGGIHDALEPGGTFSEEIEQIGRTYPETVKDKGLPYQAVIFGGGIAGMSAARYALQLGGSVVIVEKYEQRCKELELLFLNSEKNFKALTLEHLTSGLLQDADVFIGAVHQTGKRAIQVIDKEWMSQVCVDKPKIIMDISIDQGGNFLEALPTSYADPLYLDSWGNLRFGVPNIPSLSGRYASECLTSVSLPYTKALTEGYREAIKHLNGLSSALNVYEGRVVLDSVIEAHSL